MRLIAIFPLPNTVFFPGVSLPLHLFEPRYRQMAEDVLSLDRLLVIVLLREGWHEDYAGNPSVHEIGTMGRIEAHEKLPDGRYNILLEGLERVRLLPSEEGERPSGKLYRRRAVRPVPERAPEPSEITREVGGRLLARWKELERKSGLSEDERIREDLPFAVLVNRLASVVDVPPSMKQALLEEDDLLSRAAVLETYVDETLRFWRLLSRFRAFTPSDPRLN
jgi:Lon protease-like protein